MENDVDQETKKMSAQALLLMENIVKQVRTNSG